MTGNHLNGIKSCPVCQSQVAFAHADSEKIANVNEISENKKDSSQKEIQPHQIGSLYTPNPIFSELNDTTEPHE